MAKARVTITGEEELFRKFSKLADTVQAKTLERTMVAGALPLQNRAKEIVHKISGNLARSIHIGGHEDLAPDRGDIVDKTGVPVPRPELGADTVAVYVGTDVRYGSVEEWGNRTRAAHPYLRPAADETKGEVQAEVSAAWRKLVQAAAR
jgi:HK97 gp10 family phage protein